MYISWIKRIIENLNKWEYAYEFIAPVLQGKIWDCNLNPEDDLQSSKTANHWSFVLSAWAEVHHHIPQSKQQILKQIIWRNSHIRVGKCTIEPPSELVDNGLLYIKDIVNEDGGLLPFTVVKRKFSHIKWFQYTQICNAIPSHWKSVLSKDVNQVPKDSEIVTVTTLVSKQKISKYVYEILRERNSTSIEKFCNKWVKRFSLDIEYEEFCYAFESINKITKIVKLQDFQYRLLLNKIFVNDTLYHWKIKTSNLCDICNRGTKQTIIHMLIDCEFAKVIWDKIKEICGKSDDFKWNAKNIILNNVHKRNNHIVNLIVLIIKQYLFRCKCLQQKANFQQASSELLFHFLRELDKGKLSTKEMKKFRRRWNPVIHFFSHLLQ